jgi:ketoreductase RED1
MRHLMEHVGSQMRFENGMPDRSAMDGVIAQVEAAYGADEESYRRLVERRDRRTRAVSEALRQADEGGQG